MKKYFLTLAVAFYSMFATAQTNQYFWHNGNLMFGSPISQTDSITFGEMGKVDSVLLLLPQTKTIVIHDTIYINNCDKEEPQLPEGALPGEFSVSPTKKVRFSKGNLQYNAALGSHQCADGTTQQGTWRFAEHQWDYVGDATKGTVYANGIKCNNALISSSYNGWVDLFGWATSGYDNTTNDANAINYHPWDTISHIIDASYNSYGYGPSTNVTDADLVGLSEYYDWGVYNALENSGNEVENWRTLSDSEWDYLLNNRTNASNLKSRAVVCDVNGYILLPDNVILSGGITWTAQAENWTTNRYDNNQWLQLEQLGAVFLPCSCGRRWGNVTHVGIAGYYWSSSTQNKLNAGGFYFTNNEEQTFYGGSRYTGRAVRLVHNLK